MAEQPGISIFTPSKAAPNPAAPQVRSSPVSDARVADGVRSNPAQSPAQARWQADYDQLTREDVWRRQDVVITQDADGTIRTRPRNGTGNGQQSGDRQQTGAPDTGDRPQAEVGPASVEGDKLKVGEFSLSPDDIKGLMERASLEQSRKANTPETPDKYELSLPSDFVVPEGTEWTWAVDDPVAGPMLGMAKEWAHSVGLDQPQFARMMSMFAAYQLNDQRRFNDLRKAEVTKLGATGASRIDAVNRFLEATCGSQLAGALRKTMFTADSVKGFEQIISRFTSQGVSGNPGASRSAGEGGRRDGRVSDEEYSRMSFHEKTMYAQRMNGGG